MSLIKNRGQKVMMENILMKFFIGTQKNQNIYWDQ
jgi:hypothetical protein